MVEIRIKPFKAGIYVYRRIEDGTIIYVGKDSDLVTSRRHYDHNRADFKTGKRGQLINKVLQDNPDKFVYEELLYCGVEWIDALEAEVIEKWRPEFNIIGNDKYKGNKSQKKVSKLVESKGK